MSPLRASSCRASSVSSPRAEYERRLARWVDEEAALERRHLTISNLRLVTAAAIVVLGWLGLFRGALSPAWALVPALTFLALMIVHARTLNSRDRAANAGAFYRRGIERIEDRWQGVGDGGVRFLEGHSYARDLDLFGQGSLFQLLNNARTEAGEATLADWLRHPASRREIGSRQEAVRELRERTDFRESLAILAAEARVSRTGALATWAAQPPVGLAQRHALLFAASGLISLVLLIAGFAGWVTTLPVAVGLLAQGAIALGWRRPVQEVLKRADAASDDLGLLVGLLEAIERERFESPALAALRESLFTDGVPASRRVSRLRAFIAARDTLRNELVRPFALLLLVRELSAVAIDRWHGTYGTVLGRWLATVGELEALSSLAMLAFERPEYPFPTLVDEGPCLDALELAHPLLNRSAVANDISLKRSGCHVLIVSGSNMSGKSTFLRTVGVNVVLALAGGPVRARVMALSMLTIGACIRLDDSLQEGHSRFYTEILRIRRIVELTEGPQPVLFLLDEILHGTNSYDRRIGAEGIVRTLVAVGAIGLVTTHDLALTEMVSSFGDQAANVHFQDRIEGDRMVFDYRMCPGIIEHSNALALMRAVGLRV